MSANIIRLVRAGFTEQQAAILEEMYPEVRRSATGLVSGLNLSDDGSGMLPVRIGQLYASMRSDSVNGAADAVYRNLATITVPGGTMGLNSKLVLNVDYEYTSSANIKDFGVLWGGNNFVGHSPTTTAAAFYTYNIENFSSLSIQKTLNAGGNEGVINALHDTFNVDTTQDVDIVIRGKWRAANIASEFISVTGYSLWHWPGQ